MVQAKDSDADEDEVKVHVMGAIEEGEVSSDEEGEIKGGRGMGVASTLV